MAYPWSKKIVETHYYEGRGAFLRENQEKEVQISQVVGVDWILNWDSEQGGHIPNLFFPSRKFCCKGCLCTKRK